MNAGILPMLLISATVGLLLSLTTRRNAWFGFAAIAASGLTVSLFALPPRLSTPIFICAWLSVIVTAVITYLPPRLPERWAIPLSINAGVWVGALSSLSGRKLDLLLAVPVVLIFILGQWIVARGLGLGIKVVASWMIAIATLSIFVSMIPTPGYAPDHMQ